jgi:hypothetical protein
MEDLLTKIEYEKQGYRKGASAKLILTGDKVVFVSNPKVENKEVFIWVAMEYDTHVRYMAKIDDLELL